jgi:autotransporter-associated beta strand protein
MVENSRALVINSTITGSGGLTVYLDDINGTSSNLVLNGANTFTGFTRVAGNNGGLNMHLTNSLALQDSTVDYNSYGANLTFGNGGTTGQTAYTFGGLTGSANITLANNNTTVAPVALTLGNDGLNDVYSGNLLNGTGSGVGGSLVFNGIGSETLLGTGNTYTGGTSIQKGTLILGHGGVLAATNTITLGSGANSGTFQLGDSTAAVNTTVTNLQTSGTGTANAVVGGNSAVSTLTVNIASGSQTYSGILGGSGTNQNNLGLTKTRSGIFVLSGTANTYTGPTTVSAGTLTVSGQLTGLSAVGVSGGGTLNGYGTIAGMVTLAGGTTSATQGNINLQDAATSTLTLGGLTVGGAAAGQVSNLNFDLGNGTVTSDQINLGANAFVGNAGGAVINVDQLGALAQGTYTLMTYGSESGLAVGTNLTLNAPQHFGTSYALNLGASSLTLMVSGTPAPNVAYWSGVQGGANNWGDHGTSTTNWVTTQTGSTDTGAAPGTNTDVVFANSGATSASLTTQLETTYGINSLTILGTGQTTATTGTVTTIGGTGALNLIAGASGAGGLGYTGGTGIVIGADSAGLTINTSGGVGVTASQSWTNNGSNLFTVSSNISGSTIASTPVTLTLANTGAGGTNLSGAIADGSGLASQLSIVVNNTGPGITTLSGSNTYSGSTNLSAGALDVANSVALQHSTVIDGGVLTLDSAVATHAFQFGALGGSGNISLTDSGSNAVALTVGSNNASTVYSGVLSGTGNLTKVGTGMMTLSNVNTYSGGTNVSGGTLRLGDGATNNGAVAGGIVDNANVTFANPNPQTFSGVISGTGTLNVTGPGTIILNSAETYAGTTNVSGGTLQLGDGVSNDGSIAGSLIDNATVTFANLNPLSYAGAVSGSGTLRITGAGGITLSGANNFPGPISIASKLTLTNTAAATFSGTISGAGTLTVSSSAVVNLSGANNYSGGTFLTSGTINATNSSALGTGSLNSSGGTIENNSAATVTLTNPIIAASGTTTFTAVAGAGVLSVNGNISGGGIVAINYTGSGDEQINIGGNNSGFTGTIGNYSGSNAIRLKFTSPAAGSASANFVTTLAGTDTTGFTFGNGTIQFGSLSGTGVLRQDGAGTTTLVIGALNSSTTFSGALLQFGGDILNITKVGTGAQTLSGNNGWTGVTTVSGGTLALAGTTASTSAYVVGDTLANNSVILDVSGAVTQPYPVSAAQSISGFGTVNGNIALSGTINPGTVGVNSSYGTLTVQGLATLANSKLTFDLGTGAGPVITTGDLLVLGSGTNSVANGTRLAFAGSTPIGGDDYRLIGDQSSGSVVDGFNLSSFTLPATTGTQTFALSTSVDPGYIDLVVTGNAGPSTLTWNNAGGSGDGLTWDTANQNWNTGTGVAAYSDTSNTSTGDIVTFNDTNNGHYNVSISGVVHPTSVTFANSAGNYSVTGVNSSSGIAGPASLTLTGSGTVTISSSNAYTGGTNVSAGKLVLASANAFPSGTALTIASGATMQIANHGAGATFVPTLSSLSNSGTIDIVNNAMVIQNASAGTIFSEIQAGYNNGAWNGSNASIGVITSSLAANDPKHLTAVGFATGLTSFEGQNVSAGSILIKYTYYGDANLDGVVDGSDYSRTDNGYLSHLTGWFNGDFNYDGVVNGSDYTLIDNAFNTQGAQIMAAIASPTAQIAGSGSTSAVPEPATLGLLAITAVGLLGRRNRRQSY